MHKLLLINLDKKLEGVYIRRNSAKTTAIEHADDITIIVTKPEEVDTIKYILHDYMLVTGAHINVIKSHAIALGSWDKLTPMMDINYREEIILLGFHMANNVKRTTNKSWAMFTAKIRAQAQRDYYRALSLENRIRYVNDYLLARVWYTTQIFPPPKDQAREITAAISWFL
jgi:hypothetical protein